MVPQVVRLRRIPGRLGDFDCESEDNPGLPGSTQNHIHAAICQRPLPLLGIVIFFPVRLTALSDESPFDRPFDAGAPCRLEYFPFKPTLLVSLPG